MPHPTAVADIAVGTIPTLILSIPVWRFMVRLRPYSRVAAVIWFHQRRIYNAISAWATIFVGVTRTRYSPGGLLRMPTASANSAPM